MRSIMSAGFKSPWYGGSFLWMIWFARLPEEPGGESADSRNSLRKTGHLNLRDGTLQTIRRTILVVWPGQRFNSNRSVDGDDRDGADRHASGIERWHNLSEL